MSVWRATYRLQLRNGVGFAEAAALLPYLVRLGVSHLYLSPVARARSGSTHGYDVVDPNEPDPVLGGRAGFEALLTALREAGLGLVLDIVPNHMAASIENAWWRSTLEEGPASPHAAWFDIDWEDEEGRFRPLALPVLGVNFDQALAGGELTLVQGEAGRVELDYHGNRLPVAPNTLKEAGITLEPTGEEAADAVAPEALRALIERQRWRPAFWKDALASLAYRRFFDVSDLAGVRMEEPGVFKAGHVLVKELLRRRAVDGLRIDHVDGLADPKRYLVELRDLVESQGSQALIHVEKILGAGEELRVGWPVAGTTGYEFLNAVLCVLLDPEGLAALDGAYRRLTGDERRFDDVVRDAKRQVLVELFGPEVDRVVNAAAAALGPDTERTGLREAVEALVTGFAVYRTYKDADGLAAEDRAVLAGAQEEARTCEAGAARLVVLLGLLEREDEAAQRFTTRLQQLTGPVMAKALEDTAFYRWHRAIALNEVGGEPGHPDLGIEAFHGFNRRRATAYPFSLLATATHDTKRGEDVRARLVTLAEQPDAWADAVLRWRAAHQALRAAVPGGPAPDDRTLYLLYQTLVGCWPIGLAAGDRTGLDDFAGRIATFVTKAMREAKEHTRWTAPDEAWEGAVLTFLRAILDPAESEAFLADIASFAHGLARRAVPASLAQVLLKLTSPGVPDIYQGCELWDLALVDPDNRRRIDWMVRSAALADTSTLQQRLDTWKNGAVKLGVVQEALAARAACPPLFTKGEYLPLFADGPANQRVVAFARRLGERIAVTVVPRSVAAWVPETGTPLPDPACWGETCLLAEALGPVTLVDKLTGLHLDLAAQGRPRLATLLGSFPVALLITSN